MLDAALEYARRGIHVLPCSQTDKRPLVPRDKGKDGKPIEKTGGLYKATTDEAQICAWWKKHPNAMIGARTGKGFGLIVLDIDRKHGNDGYREVPDWQDRSPIITKTTTGGAHLWFNHDGPPLQSKTAAIGPGVDVKGEVGYVILPPSVLGPSKEGPGGTYSFEKGGLEDFEAIPPFPDDLRARIRTKTNRTGQAPRSDPPSEDTPWHKAAMQELEAACSKVSKAPEGERNDTLNQCGFMLGMVIGGGWLDEQTARHRLSEAARETGLDDDEIERTVEGALSAGRESPRRPRMYDEALVGLVDQTREDAGAPFQPEMLECLLALKTDDQRAFEKLRRELKAAGCRIGELDRAIKKTDDFEGGSRPSQSDILLSLIGDDVEFFHNAKLDAFVDIRIDGHRETWPVRSKACRRWLSRLFYEATARALSTEALTATLNTLESRAVIDGPERTVSIRVAAVAERIYIDLADEEWRAVEIDKDGWRVVAEPPVRFRRPSGMLPLPEPTRGGSIDDLRQFLNLPADGEDFVLVVAWLLAALRGRPPYPVLAVAGEQGSAKSFLTSVLRAIVDPNTTPLRRLSREDRDLFIAASNAHALVFDNVSGLPHWISDALCQLSSGGGFAVRQLYTDNDEVLFDGGRPVILNGIEDVVNRPDLADRTIFQMLEPIAEENRRSERDLWTAFEKKRPGILGALLDAIVVGLVKLPETRLERLPRMADFAVWITACETAFWDLGTFMTAYDVNRDEAVENVLESMPVATAVRTFVANRSRQYPPQTNWIGTAAELLRQLTETWADDGVNRGGKGWPSTPRALSGQLRRAATFLRKVGIEVTFTKLHERKIYICKLPVAERSQTAEPPNEGNFATRPSRPTRDTSDAAEGVKTDATGHRTDAAARKRKSRNSKKAAHARDGRNGRVAKKRTTGAGKTKRTPAKSWHARR